MKKMVLLAALALMCMGLKAQWSDDPAVNLCVVKESTYGKEIHVLSDGSWFLYWDRPTLVINGEDTMSAIVPEVQYFTKDGKAVWNEPFRVSSEKTQTYTVYNNFTLLDKDENLIVAVRDLRRNGANSYTVYKLDKNANHTWDRNGVSLHGDDIPDFCAALKIIQLADGSYVFAWVENASDGSSWIRLQRLSADGQRLWGNGKKVEKEGTNLTYPYMVDAGNNEFILMYAQGATEELYARKLDFDGNDVWKEATLMFNGTMGSTPLWTRMAVAPIDGGLLAAFPAQDPEQPLLSWVKGDGTHGFVDAEKGFRIGYTDDFRTGNLRVAVDEEGKTIYAIWREFDPNTQSWQRLAMQKVGFDGELMFAPTGLTIAPLLSRPVAYYNLALGNKNTVLASYMENVGEAGTQDIMARAALVNAEGHFVWEDTTVDIATLNCSKSDMLCSPIRNDQWILVWNDNRDFESLNYHNLYAQNLRMDGSLGTGPVANESHFALADISMLVYPNPARESLHVRVNCPASVKGDLRMELLGLNGAVLATMGESKVRDGINDFEYSRPKGLVSGMYILRAVIGGESCYTKIILK